jgi:hypothetical protein
MAPFYLLKTRWSQVPIVFNNSYRVLELLRDNNYKMVAISSIGEAKA